MRIDLAPIIAQAETLVAAIESKGRSRSAHAAHMLLCVMPSPCWAESAPGCVNCSMDEYTAIPRIEALRFSALCWLALLINPDKMLEPDDEWPTPIVLNEAIRHLAELTPQYASVSRNTAPTAS